MRHCIQPVHPLAGGFRDNIFVGNVVTSRVNRDKVNWRGSSPKGVEMPDLIRTSDPWFRPVDLQFGPDGALYIADFYNRIIGHCEVRLGHGRDRERAAFGGWSIRDRKQGKRSTWPPRRLAKRSPSCPTTRAAWQRLIISRTTSVPQQPSCLAGAWPSRSRRVEAHGVGAPPLGQARRGHPAASGRGQPALVRSHSRASPHKNWTARLPMVLGGLGDDSPRPRAATDAHGLHLTRPRPHPARSAGHVPALMNTWARSPDRPAQQHPRRRSTGTAADLKQDKAAMRRFMDVALALKPVAGELLLAGITDANVGRAELAKYLRHIAPTEGLDDRRTWCKNSSVMTLISRPNYCWRSTRNQQRGLTAEQGVRRGPLLTRELPSLHHQAALAPTPPRARRPRRCRGRRVAERSTKVAVGKPSPGSPTRSPWLAQNATRATGGEMKTTSPVATRRQVTGVLRSQPFTAPAELRFFSAATASSNSLRQNFVRLVDAEAGAG